MISIYTPLEERLHVAIHGVGLLAGVIGTFWLLSQATVATSGWRVLGMGVFGLSAIMMFTTSTIYHYKYISLKFHRGLHSSTV